MQTGEISGEVESEPVSRDILRGVTAVKAIEDVRLRADRNAASGVADRQPDRGVVRRGREVDAAAGPGRRAP